MQIRVTGRNIDLTEAMKSYVNKKVKRLEKYLEESTDVQVVLTVEKFRQIAEVTISSKYGNFYGSEESHDIYASIDMVMDKLEEQARRKKERLQQKNREAVLSNLLTAGDEEYLEGPQVVETKRFAMKPMSLEEALLQMELSKEGFMVFLNANTNQVNVIYRRRDGHYGLIEPEM